ncbi:hypothetical protein ANANG_G00198380 [Anguilla anguilla]|uniref:U-box domain-containing protein n=1 Tax=Anguilla anguilla TaxID=7936 RepID=A0A9D3M422_ANGAN|nr:hypothetical protein ANANG_G00198380 [Anguilla anguilla]
MSLPMLLPSGAVIDSSTLETYQQQEATWGRPPNDPFTGVPFSGDAQPLPCPLLKGRIDLFLLRGGGGAGAGPQWAGSDVRCSRNSHAPPDSPTTPLLLLGPHLPQIPATPGFQGTLPHPLPWGRTEGVKWDSGVDPLQETPAGGTGERGAELRDWWSPSPSDSWTTAKKVRKDTPPQPDSCSSSSSHEQRLADSLDQALSSALRNLPAFTAHQAGKSCATESQGGGTNTGESRCALCACPLSQYPSCPPAFRLPCEHLLCRPCLSLRAPKTVPASSALPRL